HSCARISVRLRSHSGFEPGATKGGAMEAPASQRAASFWLVWVIALFGCTQRSNAPNNAPARGKWLFIIEPLEFEACIGYSLNRFRSNRKEKSHDWGMKC